MGRFVMVVLGDLTNGGVVKVVFRTDASVNIGTGHVIRCLTLAKVLRRNGANCQFVCRNHYGNLVELIQKEGFPTIELKTNQPNKNNQQHTRSAPNYSEWLGVDMALDARQTIDGLAGKAVDLLVVDHYALDYRWEEMLRPYTRVIMAIDDLADRAHDCDLLLDQNLAADMLSRYDRRLPSGCVKLLGPSYALLQEEYARLHSNFLLRQYPVKRILIFFGGTDSHNCTGLSISAFLSLSRDDIALDVVINPRDPKAMEIIEMANNNPAIKIHNRLPSLAGLIRKADLAIGAGGATTWERCCLGLPAIVITVADNQVPVAKMLAAEGIINWVGHYDSISVELLADSLREVLVRSDLVAWSRKCIELVDGMGSNRVMQSLLSVLNNV